MLEFASLSSEEKVIYFQQTADAMDLPAHLVEKDFWVCFALRVLFSLPEFKEHLTFKGGTSLSKVYKVIERFSEDIDFAISRDCIGFGEKNAPDADGVSGEQRNKRLKALSEACLAIVREELFPALDKAFQQALKVDGWMLELNEEQNSNQQIYFHYPKSDVTEDGGYNPSHVRIELTARTDNHPAESRTVTPYIAEQFQDAIKEPQVQVNALTAERTFWEKVTILHQFHFQENPERVTAEFSRHYYDVFQLDAKGFSETAIEQIELLPEVADHKNTYYRQAWARYDLARNPKTLEVVPHQNILATIKKDYQDMKEMMFGDTPDFDEILDCLHILKQRINSL